MPPWLQIAKPFSFHFALNCAKTVIGAGFVGYGVALALSKDDDDDDKDNHNDNGNGQEATPAQDNKGATAKLVRKCVTVTTTIGFGLFLSLPSLMSQIVWETMIPAITATDIAYDLGTENVMGILPKWNIKKPKLSSLVLSKEKIVDGVGGLIREAEAMAEETSGSRGK